MYVAFLMQTGETDSAHDIQHIRRVVENARVLNEIEGASWEVLRPAAWLHDCVIVPKNSPDRKRASVMAAEKAARYLSGKSFDSAGIKEISHCIEAHSYSAGIKPRTKEAQILQDADRLDALGAIGIARCLLTGSTFGASLYHPEEPQPVSRGLDEKKYILDHFYEKLLTLSATMNTRAGKLEGQKRTKFMKAYLYQLYGEIGA